MRSFLDQVRTDFEGIAAGEFSEEVIISDGTRTITLRCIFDEPAEEFDPNTNSDVIAPSPRLILAETATDFNLRRGDLDVTVRGRTYKSRPDDWTYDGVGELNLSLVPYRV